VFLQQGPIFLFERHLAVMLLLIADIARHRCSVRDAHAECAISFLPGEPASVFVHPFGRVGFKKLNGLGQRNGWRQVKQKMRVVRHAIDSDWSHLLVAADASQIRPEFRLGIFGYGRLTIFCAEHKMEMILNERVRHELCQPFQGFDCISLFPFPTYAGGLNNSALRAVNYR
jgi:hypothetical protein